MQSLHKLLNLLQVTQTETINVQAYAPAESVNLQITICRLKTRISLLNKRHEYYAPVKGISNTIRYMNQQSPKCP